MNSGEEMDIEELAKQMRETALAVERELAAEDIAERKRKQDELERIKALYFNAGRWAGGARDRKARQAFDQVSLHG